MTDADYIEFISETLSAQPEVADKLNRIAGRLRALERVALIAERAWRAREDGAAVAASLCGLQDAAEAARALGIGRS